MSIPLAEALRDVKLEPGHVYSCQVNGHWVELRVLPAPPATDGSSIPEADIMLEPWVVLPPPKPIKRVRAKRGVLPPPDLSDFPADDQAAP